MEQNQWNRNRSQFCRECREPWDRPDGGYSPYVPPGQEMGRPMQPYPPHGMPGRPYPAYQDVPPMPYYLAYPYPMYMQGEEDDEKDLERLVSMFPKSAKTIQPLIEEECDRMEYDGSLMFDEYPDKLMVERIIENIYQKVQGSAEEKSEMEPMAAVFATQCRNCNSNRFGDGVQDLISVMLFGEMHRRRCRRRRCKRWW